MFRIYATEPNFLAEYLETRDRAISVDLPDKITARLEFDPETFRIKSKSILSYKPEKHEAHISIAGPLSRKGPDLFDVIFGYGGTGYDEIESSIREAEDNPDVDSIVFDMDTPGGEISGLDEVAQLIADSKKKTVAVNHGMMASAGYWLASACDEIYATSASVETGSVGVLIAGYDISKALDERGMRKVVIVSENAPDKYASLEDKKGIEILQDRVNALERIFHARVAAGRGTTTDDVKERYGRGRVLVAQDPGESDDAMKVGMIDGIISGSDDTEKEAGSLPEDTSPAVAGQNRESHMDLEKIMAENPAVAAQIRERDRENYERGKAEISAETKKRVDAASPYLTNATYPEAVRKAASRVVLGEKSVEALNDLVDLWDVKQAKESAETASAETTEAGNAPSQQAPAASEGGVINTEADYQREIAKVRGEGK